MSHQSNTTNMAVWFIHKSKKRKMIYYYNPETKESLWEQPEGVTIIDKTKELDSVKNTGNVKAPQPSNNNINNDKSNKTSCSDFLIEDLDTECNLDDEFVRRELMDPKSDLMDPSVKHSELRQKFEEEKRKFLLHSTQPLDSNQGSSEGSTMHSTRITTPEVSKNKRRLQNSFPKEANGPICSKSNTKTTRFKKVSKTPIQDRFTKQKADLLRKQNQKFKKKEDSNTPSVNKPQQMFPFDNHQTNKSNIEGSTDNESKLKKIIPIHHRLGWPASNNTQNQLFNRHQNDSALNILKRKLSPDQDLRTKLQKRKRGSSHTTPATDTSTQSEMEWEEFNPSDPIHLQDSYSVADREQEQESPLTTPVQVTSLPEYKQLFLVCDTCALLEDSIFVERLIRKGSYLGLPIKVIIPFIIFDELDKIKNVKEDIGYNARKISRIIKSSQQNANLHIQEGSKSRTPVGSLELKQNDDLVLNCCLQTSEECKEGELAILMTNDNNLSNKGTSFKLDTHRWDSFKKWARGITEQRRRSSLLNNHEKSNSLLSYIPTNNYNVEDEKMDVDLPLETELSHLPDAVDHKKESVLNNEEPSSDITDKPITAQVQNCIRSHLEELKVDFQAFLHDVLNQALDTEYGALKSHSNSIKPSWTLLNYVVEVRTRWFLITSTNPSKKVQEICSKLIAGIKKCNSGKVDLVSIDVENIFLLCSTLAKMFPKKYMKHINAFLERLKLLKDEWMDAQCSVSCTDIDQRISEDDVQPVDVACQNIYNCLNSDYEEWRKKIEDIEKTEDVSQTKKQIAKELSDFYQNITNFVQILKGVFQGMPSVLSTTNKNLLQLHKLIAHFSNGKGTTFGFEITIENLIEFFQDSTYRENVKQIVDNFENLETHVDTLLTATEDFDELK